MQFDKQIAMFACKVAPEEKPALRIVTAFGALRCPTLVAQVRTPHTCVFTARDKLLLHSCLLITLRCK
jgi:hypothetical protein